MHGGCPQRQEAYDNMIFNAQFSKYKNNLQMSANTRNIVCLLYRLTIHSWFQFSSSSSEKVSGGWREVCLAYYEKT